MKIALVAGETSGDQLGAGLISRLKDFFPDAVYYGIGGPSMQQAGLQTLYEMEDISMIGLEGAFSKLPKIISIRRSLIRRFITDKPDIFIGIDVPDFNLGLEKKLTQNDIICVHYVSPTIWAWRPNRIHTIKKAVAHMLVLFPFEKKIYDQHQIAATFVGHPIADEVDKVLDQQSCRNKFQIHRDSKVIALLPGSRHSEITRHTELFLETAKALSKEKKNIQFIISAVNKAAEEYINQIVTNKFSYLQLKTVSGDIREVISASDLVLAASGTVTLETALMEKPLVMAYKVSKLSELMVKYFSRVKYYAMPNFLLDEPEIPEFVQDDATVDNLTEALNHYLSNTHHYQNIVNKFKIIKNKLKVDANIVAADVVCSYLPEVK